MNDSFVSTNQNTEIDSINSYFECITECSIVDGHQECITRCLELDLKIYFSIFLQYLIGFILKN